MSGNNIKTGKDASRTQGNILAAATVEFSRKGFDGARIDEIAKRSKANKNMIYHYFGNKQNLFTAVLERAYEDLRLHQKDLSVIGLDPIDGMRKLVGYTFDAFVQMPYLIQLINSENLHKGIHIRKSKNVRRMYDPLLTTIGELLERGALDGVFRRNIDPVNLYISIASLVYHYVSNHHTLEVLVDRKLMTDRHIGERRDHVLDMILSYCAADTSIAQIRGGLISIDTKTKID